jgi:hypothetical protein
MDRILQSYQCTRKILPAKEINDKRYDRAHKQAGSQRKIKGKPSPLDNNIAGQMAQPGDLPGEQENYPENHQQDTKKYKRFTQIRHT